MKVKEVLEFNHDKLKKIERAYGNQTKIHTTLKREDNDNSNSSKHDYGDGGEGGDSSTGTPPHSNSDNDYPNEENHNKTYENFEDTHGIVKIFQKETTM